MRTLKTERIQMRPMNDADAPRLATLASEKEIAATTTNIPHPYSEDDARSWIATHASMAADGRGLHYGIEHDGDLVGVISLMTSATHQRAELGYWIGKPYWNKGLATEAALAVLAHAFDDLGLHRVYAYHFLNNPASQRVLTRIGMKYEGCLREHVSKFGERCDLVCFGILKDEWERLRTTEGVEGVAID